MKVTINDKISGSFGKVSVLPYWPTEQSNVLVVWINITQTKWYVLLNFLPYTPWRVKLLYIVIDISKVLFWFLSIKPIMTIRMPLLCFPLYTKIPSNIASSWLLVSVLHLTFLCLWPLLKILSLLFNFWHN